MANQISAEIIEYIVARIVEKAKEATSEAKKDKNDGFKNGKTPAYYEVWDILRTEL